MINKQSTFINQVYHDEAVNFWRQKTEQAKVSVIGPSTFNRVAEQYQEAIKLDRNDIYLRRKYAMFLWLIPKMPLADLVSQYRQIVEQIPHDVKMLNQLAEMEYRMGDYDSGLKHALKAVKLNSMDDAANYSAGRLYEKKAQYKKAQKYITKAIKLDPTIPLYYNSLSLILNEQGKADRAEKVYRKGIEAIPADAYLHFNLALLLQRKGQLEEAEKERQKAIALDPNLIRQRGSLSKP